MILQRGPFCFNWNTCPIGVQQFFITDRAERIGTFSKTIVNMLFIKREKIVDSEISQI